jgi:hypothetical protein
LLDHEEDLLNYPNCNCRNLSENIAKHPESASDVATEEFFVKVEDEIRSKDVDRIIGSICIVASLALVLPGVRKCIDRTFWVITLPFLDSPEANVRNVAISLADLLLFQAERSNWEVLHVMEANFRGVDDRASFEQKLGCLGICRAMVECGYGELLASLLDNDMANGLLSLIEELVPEFPVEVLAALRATELSSSSVTKT